MRKNTLDDDEVNEQFITALDSVIYAPVVSRLFTHQQRAAVDLLTMQQWATVCLQARIAMPETHRIWASSHASAMFRGQRVT
ncbi:hypothetical protein CYMTET_16212 [Cymbomonas tetramitiformis]|uniref:Uncharacterized protein n=1 Tax=Cymbomonas tetramitiformis TaxID=36881 RepID=A0AAE0L858_9CHLO|nr:hypothetical protein CYMTET_16212 [Cymbomonas tetramitiformis]